MDWNPFAFRPSLLNSFFEGSMIYDVVDDEVMILA